MKGQFVRGTTADPAVVAAERFRVAYELCNSVLSNGDCIDELLDASDSAFEKLMSTQACTIAGVTEKLRAAVANYYGFDVPLGVLTSLLPDLERLQLEALP